MYQSRWAPKPPPVAEEEKAPVAPAVPAEEVKVEPEQPSSTIVIAEAKDVSPPPPATYEDSQPEYYDSFAQTGGDQDDLFDDFIPMDESERLRSDEDLFNDDFTPAAEPVLEAPAPEVSAPEVDDTAPAPAPTQVPAPTAARGDGGRGRGRGRDRGRGRGRGGAQHHSSSGAQTKTTDSAPAQSQTKSITETEGQTKPAAEAPENAPTGPRKDSVPSVRGDRHATGGLKKPKLTEEELAEKMAKISVKNASLAAAHARAEADAASFAQRESKAKEIASQRQKEERRDRQQMMGEREKNRMRKLKAMEGREWDAEKNEDDFRKGGTYDKKGSFAGDEKDYNDGREYLYKEEKGGDRGKSSAGKGGRGGRKDQSTPKKEEFPALPGNDKKADAAAIPSVSGPKTSWADQVESSNS